MLPRLEPMNAVPASSLRTLPGGEWRLEPKLDGWRAMVHVEDDAATIRSRRGRDLTSSLPELEHLPDGLRGRDAILDGELVVGAGTASDFYRLGPRLARGHRTARGGCPVSFVAFDLLWLDGRPLHQLPYFQRRLLLEGLKVDHGCWRTMEALHADPEALLATCERLDLEGIVAKRVEGLYRPGARSRDWIKLKTASWQHHHGLQRRVA